MNPLPSTESGLYAWLICLTALYMVIAAVASRRQRASLDPSRVFDGIMFSTSLMLLAGLVNPPTMLAIGDVNPFLLTQGGFGVVYSLLGIRRAASHK